MANIRVRCERSQKRGEYQPNVNLESMVKLLLYMETELQFKEELLELLLEDDRVQPIINEKLTELNKRNRHDPSLALGRDGLYDKETWGETFRDWRGTSPQVVGPVENIIRSNPHHLGATAATRCIELAEEQLKKYTETYVTLQKAAKSYKKLKQKVAKEKRKSKDCSLTDGPAENAAELISKLEENNKLLYDKLSWERNRADKLENQVEVINATMWRDRRKSGYIIKVLVEEVEQLSQHMKMQTKLNQGPFMNGYHVETV